jgi:phosphoribosyl 1,2-cyclic phosphodiesterase
MAAGITVLASGSGGNCTVVSSTRTRLLVDAGLSCRETFRRMRLARLEPESLNAILISHEHSDHICGVLVLAKKLRIPVYMTAATHQAWLRQVRQAFGATSAMPDVQTFHAGRSFEIGDIRVMPFTIPHDAADPVAFTFRADGAKLGVVTDLGYMPPNVCDHIQGCDALMIESNHDLEMLRGGPYPWAVKQRVMSRVGHLSNEALADFLLNVYDGAATYLVLAHLSEQNNHPEIARRAAERALGTRGGLLRNRVMLASQAQPLEPIWL